MMQLLIDALNRIPEFQQLLSALEGGRSPAALSGVAAVPPGSHGRGDWDDDRAARGSGVRDEGEGERLARDLAAFVGQEVPVLTPRSFTFHNAATVSRQWEHRRLALMEKLAAGRLPFLVATVEGLLQRTLPPQALEQYCFRLKVGPEPGPGPAWRKPCRPRDTSGVTRWRVWASSPSGAASWMCMPRYGRPSPGGVFRG